MSTEGVEAQTALLDREREQVALAAAIEAIARGRGGFVHIEGEAGIGKTRLLEAALRLASSRDVKVLTADLNEFEARRPFGPLLDCLDIRQDNGDSRRAGIADLLLAPARPSAPLLAAGALVEARAVEAIVSLIADVCAQARVVLAFEDLQWADPSTLTVLHRLLGQLLDLPLLLMGTSRPVPRRPELDRLRDAVRGGELTHLLLGPLDDEAIAQLVSQMVGGPPGPGLVSELSRAGGNPLFVTELVAALRMQGGLRSGDPGLSEPVAVMPGSLVSTILHRLSFLQPKTLEVLRVASVFGSRFDARGLSSVLGRTTGELLPALEESLRARLLKESGEYLHFCHDLVREALYHDLPAAVRTGLHRDVAHALTALGAPPERIAEHLVRGATMGDREAVKMLHHAASTSAGRAPAMAADLLDHALSLASPDDPLRDSLLADQAVNLLFCGKGLEAEAVCRDVLSRPIDPVAEGTLRRCLVHALINQGRMKEAVREAEETTSSPTLPAVEVARLGAWGAFGRVLTGDLAGAENAAAAARAAAEACDDDYAAAIASSTLGMARHFAGRSSEAAELLDDAVRRADRSAGREAHRFPVHVVRALILISLDRFVDACCSLSSAFRLCEDLGTRANLPLCQRSQAILHFWSGAWDDAIAEHEASIELADETSTRDGTVLTSAIGALIAVHRGALATAKEMLEFSEREFVDAGPQFGLHWTMWARGLLHDAQGCPEAAVASLSDAWALCTTAGLVSEYPVLAPDLVRLAVATGNLNLGRDVASTMRSLAEANPGVTSLRGGVLLCEGLLSHDGALLMAALECYESSPRSHQRARAQEDTAVILARDGRLADARMLAGRAIATYEDLLAAHDVSRCDARLRAVGIRRGRSGRKARARTGWDALTPTELRVAELVAQGHSNPEIARRMFISRHTVHTHVSHILAKLGLNSRVELAAMAARRG